MSLRVSKSLGPIVFLITLLALSYAQAQIIDDFQRRLNQRFDRADSETVTQQVIYGSVEAVAAYQLNGLITKVDEKAIATIHAQIDILKNSSDLPPQVRQSRINALKRELSKIEGGIAKRMGRGTAKFLVRSGQLLLVLDIGSRIYVLNALDERDPGYVPFATIFCTEVRCPDVNVGEAVLIYSSEAFNNIRRELRNP